MNEQDRQDVLSIKDYIDTKIASVNEKIETITNLQKDAVNLAAHSLELRLENMNEFRTQINKERVDYIKREIFEARIRPLERMFWGIAAIVSLLLISVPIVIITLGN